MFIFEMVRVCSEGGGGRQLLVSIGCSSEVLVFCFLSFFLADDDKDLSRDEDEEEP